MKAARHYKVVRRHSLVNVFTPDEGLYEQFLKEYPGKTYEEQIHTDHEENGEVQGFWISDLHFSEALDFLARNKGDYEIHSANNETRFIRGRLEGALLLVE